MSPRMNFRELRASVGEMVESTKMALQMVSQAANSPTIDCSVAFNSEESTIYNISRSNISTRKLPECLNKCCGGSLNASVEDQLSLKESLLGTCKSTVSQQ